MDVVVRSLKREDLEAALPILVAGSLSAHGEDPKQLDAYWEAAQETRRRHGDVLVAEASGEVIGVCQVMIFPHFQHTGGLCCEIESVHVRSDRRSMGVVALMLAHAEKMARDSGCYRIQLTSRNVRVDAHRFYEANGFEWTSKGFKKSLLD